ncbi:MAG: hypothetical protein ACREEP_06185 [Dongiaceae bacterium]
MKTDGAGYGERWQYAMGLAALNPPYALYLAHVSDLARGLL